MTQMKHFPLEARSGDGQPRSTGAGGTQRDHPELPRSKPFQRGTGYGVSLAYVSECVRAQTGRTYKELLQKHRMETAARLLRRSD